MKQWGESAYGPRTISFFQFTQDSGSILPGYILGSVHSMNCKALDYFYWYCFRQLIPTMMPDPFQPQQLFETIAWELFVRAKCWMAGYALTWHDCPCRIRLNSVHRIIWLLEWWTPLKLCESRWWRSLARVVFLKGGPWRLPLFMQTISHWSVTIYAFSFPCTQIPQFEPRLERAF